MTSADEFIIDLLIDRGLVAAETVEAARASLQEALSDPAKPHKDLVSTLVEAGHVDHRQVMEILADEFGMAMVEPGLIKPTPEAVKTMPRSLAVRYHAFPISREGGTLRVAIADPLDMDGVDSLSHVLQLSIEPCIALRDQIDQAIEKFYGSEDSVEHMLSEMSEEGEATIDEMVDELTDAHQESMSEADAPIIKLVYRIITEAISRRASDIHLEPLEKRFRVRYRIDGVLHEIDNPPKRLQLAIIARLKIMADISIAEKRIPQDGRIQLVLSGKEFDFRVSSLPTEHGESIVMRILDKEGLLLGLPELGFFSDDQAEMEKFITLPDGIFLVTGPTGSGKTTTLYACLNYINRPDRKIITVEDPVEYRLAGVNQVQVRAEINMTFAAALRSMLRQAPNIIMIGEIRDLETAEIAINASLTGHMVFSTLHTNDAPSAVTRLVDIGVKPFLVAASLRATMAQRLVRRICSKCKEPYTPDPLHLRALNMTESQAEAATFMIGKGCSNCHGTGFRGRMSIVEIFSVTEEIERLIYENASTGAIRRKARETGMRSLREDGIRKATAG
ncbi:MAG TPA: ATPase, T2SS/T4P/T4SS family, partial [Opitutales bacterium]|nr:ATPase, T2SS/T4P/T4SS family [Opitutales bacterium]